jgi:hypothetical protein
MGNERDLVITAYGHDKTIDKIAISSFDNAADNNDSSHSDANTYCHSINGLELGEDSWVFAKTVSENTQYSLGSFFPVKFDIMLKLDDRAIQKVFRDVDSQELAMAMKGENEILKEKIFRNMSKRAAGMLQEDMEYMGPVKKSRVRECQDKIVAIILYLESLGEIVIAHEEDTVK